MGDEKNMELLKIEAIEAMMPGFHKLSKLLIKEKKDAVYLEGFFDGMLTMKKIELGMDCEGK